MNFGKFTIWLLLVVGVHFQGKAQSMFSVFSQAQAKAGHEKLKKVKDPLQKTALLLALSEYHLKKPGERKQDLDSCKEFLDAAFRLISSTGNKKDNLKAQIVRAILLHEQADTKNAKLELQRIVRSAENLQLYNEKGRALYELAALTRFEDQYQYFEQALAAFRQGGDRIGMARLLVVLSDREMAGGRFEQAYRWLLEAEKYEQTPRTYVLLAGVTNYYRDQTESLRYGLLGVEVAKKQNNLRAEAEAYAGLGELYRLMYQDQNALNAFQHAMAIMVKLNMFPGYYDMARGIAYTYLGMGKTVTAVESYLQNMGKFPPNKNIDQFRYHVVLTNLYLRANDLKNASYHHEKAKALVPKGENPNGFYSLTRTSAEFYFRTKDLEKARALYLYGNKVSGEKVEHLLRLASIDSIAGNYQSALNFSQSAKKLNDSLLSEARSKVVVGLQIRHDLKQKESSLQIKDAALKIQGQKIQVLDQKALLLRQQAALSAQEAKFNANKLLLEKMNAANQATTIKLKDQNIKILNKQTVAQASQLKQEALTKKIIFALIILAIIVILLLVRQYHIKQKNNRIITEKNALLQQLVQDKSWLLKEMHHRVKNNLHTVMSLLESQSAYLNDEALAAVQNSQHRIFAMSLIHQKLYQSEDISSINMAIYIPELVNYLREFIPKERCIQICMSIDPIEFNVSNAVPLGLIVNEVVTNSIKYAFNNMPNGKIELSLKGLGTAFYQLQVSDNGKGLPKDFNIDLANSLGLKLIRGLSHQLDAELKINGENGTVVALVIPVDPSANHSRKNHTANEIDS